MRIYDTTNTELSLIHEAWDLCDADINSYPLAKIIRRFNIALEALIGEIIVADGTWQYDDTNWTNLPVGKGNLVNGQEAYTFADEYLSIEAVEILLSDGKTYQRLKPLDHQELNGMSPSEYFGMASAGNPNKGIPEYYDVLGDSIFLYPAPDSSQITLTNGIRVWFKRTADIFTISDTTQEPGLPSSYHSILSYMAAIPYCMKYHKDRVALYKNEVNEMKKKLLDFYGQREKYARKVLTGNTFNYK